MFFADAIIYIYISVRGSPPVLDNVNARIGDGNIRTGKKPFAVNSGDARRQRVYRSRASVQVRSYEKRSWSPDEWRARYNIVRPFSAACLTPAIAFRPREPSARVRRPRNERQRPKSVGHGRDGPFVLFAVTFSATAERAVVSTAS